jgi:hypothetical protein
MATATSVSKAAAKPWLGIVWGGLACGILDFTSAIVAYGPRGVSPARIGQSIAAGAIGREAAFSGGVKTALLGVFFHFLIAFGAATVFYLASRKIPFLIQHPIISGILYGEVVFVVMRYVVIPLSATKAGPWSWAAVIAGPGGHPLVVGIPIAFAVSWFAKRSKL